MANTLAYRPALTNTGCVSCHGVASTAADDTEEEEDDEKPPHRGAGVAVGHRMRGCPPQEAHKQCMRDA